MKRWLLLIFLFASTTSCSKYFTRKSCEKVNWFQHIYNVAMEGKRPEEDPRYKECEKAETDINSAEVDRGFKAGMENYCKPDTAYAKGAAGSPSINYDFCDSNLAPRMKARYIEGLRKFCQPDAGYTFASTGGVYQSQCPKDLEVAFLAKYRKGRALFLKNKITGNETEIATLDKEIREQQNLRNQVTLRIATLPRTTVVSKNKTYNPATKSYQEQTVVTEDPQIKRQRENLESELRSINFRVEGKQNTQRSLREQIQQYRSEMESLQ